VELGIGFGEFVNRALREVLRARPPEGEPRFRMITFGSSSEPVHREPSELKRALEDEEAERLETGGLG
jgi:hypothetical protein